MTTIDEVTPATEPLRPRRGPSRPKRRRPSAGKPMARFDAGRVAQARQRNPTWLVAGVMLVVLSALGGVLLFSSRDDRVDVIVAATDLPPGEPVEQADLRIARVAVDDGVATITPDAVAALVGQQPVGRVPAGTLLSPGMFADELPLGPDEIVFGAALDPGEAPLSGLRTGAAVELVSMQLGDPAAAATPGGTEPGLVEADEPSASPIGTGTVWAVEPIATGQLWVSMRVSRAVGLQASLASALDELRVVLIGAPG
ncbi:MAG: SAF domain-containing protein [Ilumatobacteraceae bacterium]